MINHAIETKNGNYLVSALNNYFFVEGNNIINILRFSTEQEYGWALSSWNKPVCVLSYKKADEEIISGLIENYWTKAYDDMISSISEEDFDPYEGWSCNVMAELQYLGLHYVNFLSVEEIKELLIECKAEKLALFV